MPDVIPFDFDGDAVRVVMQDDDPWFVAKDVCDVLEIGKHRDAVARLDEDERGSVIVDTLGGQQNVAAVSESGLYSLIFRSRKEEAKRFRKWVTGEVLPALRRHGRYGDGSAAQALPESLALKLKSNLRAQALHCAVQVVKMQEVENVETEVDRLYEKYCVKFAAKPERKEEDPDCPDLVHRFLDEAMLFTDVSIHGTHPRHLKTQMKDVYELFREFCREQEMKEYEIPSMRWLGGCFKHRKDVIRVSPRDRVFYNIVPRYE